MGNDLNVNAVEQYRSHPNKLLKVHTDGVLKGVQRFTTLKIAETAAIFHDVGKLNPYFQQKLEGKTTKGYSNHAYLSAYAWLAFCRKNREVLEQFFDINRPELCHAITAIIAHHHGNLPDCTEVRNIFRERETKELLLFLQSHADIPVSEFLQQFENLAQHQVFSLQEAAFTEKFLFEIKLPANRISKPLDFFLETQFAFASLLLADKADASEYEKESKVAEFVKNYHASLQRFTDSFTAESALNKVRTEMRDESVQTIRTALEHTKQRVFTLTAPTGAGKTVMLLSLAGEVLRQKGAYRILYALPFLSITEQVEEICKKVFGADQVQRIDSKAENAVFQRLQENADDDPEEAQKLLNEDFAMNTFDYPFIITTFVRFFETLVSNKNATLLKLPNFAQCIFLIDEIQALPPRLYGFFTALLEAFCKKFDSYAILSTATMPDFVLPEDNSIEKNFPKKVFVDYQVPKELLQSEMYFSHSVFNRYTIYRIPKRLSITTLADELLSENASALIILNTIDDTKRLHTKLLERNVNAKIILLNTHFTPNDRIKKIECAKRFLESDKRVILISTQLIEAGVDIDFPVVYRDMCSLPSLIQSAGRCNRNGKREMGRVVLFELYHDEKRRADLIYRGADKKFMEFANTAIQGQDFEESSLFDIQKRFFGGTIRQETRFGYHESSVFQQNVQTQKKAIFFAQRIQEAAFNEIGKFRLIDKSEFGEEFRYYVPSSQNDIAFERFGELVQNLIEAPFKDFAKRKLSMIAIEQHLKMMQGNIVQIRLRPKDIPPITIGEVCFGIHQIDIESYDFETGIRLDTGNQII
jgi:CRISPR-associated endonuclease/helicase Cas3